MLTTSEQSRRGRRGCGGMTVIEAIASIALSAALAVAVAQTVAMSARARVAVQQRADGLMAACNALETLRATDTSSLEKAAQRLTGPVAGLPAARMEITLSDVTFGEVAGREILVEVFGRPDAAPLVIAGWHIAAEEQTNDQ